MDESKKKKSISRAARAAIIGISLASILMSCDNMLTGEDVTSVIGTDVATANAETVNVTIKAEPTSGGTLSLSGPHDEKVGVGFDLTATPYDAYVFSGWTATGSGSVTFDDAAATTTKAKVGVKASDVVIYANFAAKPKVSSTTPVNNDKSVGTNKIIKVVFTKSLKASTILLDYVTVTTISKGLVGTIDPTDITKQFTITPIVPTGASDPIGFSLKNPTGLLISQQVQITISKEILDTAGNPMAEDYSFQFYTGTGAVAEPSVLAIKVAKGSSGIPLYSAAGAYNGYPLYIKPTYDVDAASEQELYRIKTIVTDVDNATSKTKSSGGTAEEIEADFNGNWNSVSSSTASAHAEGWKCIEVQVMDNYNQWSVLSPANDSINLLYDKTGPTTPTISSVANSYLNGSTYYYQSGGVVFTPAASDPACATGTGVAGSGIAGYTTSSSGASPAANITMTTSGSIYAVDNAGNVSAAGLPCTVALDNTPPSITGVALSSSVGTAWVKQSNQIILQFTASDAGSGIASGSPAVTVRSGGAALTGTPTITPVGSAYTWSYTMLAGDTQGAITYSIAATDNVTNVATPVTAGTGSVTYDYSGPSITPAGATATWTGSSATYAADATQVTLFVPITDAVSGVDGANTSITVKIGSTTLTTLQAPVSVAAGGYQAVFTTTTDQTGEISYSVNTKDNAGNSSSVSNQSLPTARYVDAVKPVIGAAIFSAPNSGAFTYAPAATTVTFSIPITENGGSGINGSSASSTLTVNGVTRTPSSAAVSGSNYVVSFSVPAGGDSGEIAYTLSINDVAGNTGTTGGAVTTSKYVDAKLPTIESVSFDGPTDAYAQDNEAVTIRITAKDTGGSGLTGKSPTVKFYSNGTELVRGVTPTQVSNDGSTAVYTASYTTAKATDPEGVIGYAVAIVDVAGNASAETATSKNTTTTGKTYDHNYPTIDTAVGSGHTTVTSNKTITGTGPYYIPNADDTATVTLTIPVSDTPSGVNTTNSNNLLTVKVGGSGGTAIGSFTANSLTASSWTVTFDAPTGVSGDIWYSMTLYDNAGNYNTTAATCPTGYTIDSTAPVMGAATFSAPNSGTFTYAPAATTVTFSIPITENESGINESSAAFALTVNGVTTTTSSEAFSGSNYVVSFSVPAGGDSGQIAYTFSVKDGAGNTGATSGTVSTGKYVDAKLPTLGFTSFFSGNSTNTVAKTGDLITLKFSAADTGNSGLVSPIVTVLSGTHALTGTAPSLSNSGSEYTWTYTMAAGDYDGAITYTVTASDGAGNSASPSLSGGGITLDHSDPSISNITFLSNNAAPLSTAWAMTGSVVTLQFDAKDNAGGLGIAATPTAVVKIGSSTLVGSVSGPVGNTYKWTYTMLVTDPEGALSYTISNVKDLAGNLSGDSTGAGVTFDRTAPAFASNSPTVHTSVIQQGSTTNYRLVMDTSAFTEASSGVKLIEYAKSNDDWLPLQTLGTEIKTGTDYNSGSNYIVWASPTGGTTHIRLTDLAGNTGTIDLAYDGTSTFKSLHQGSLSKLGSLLTAAGGKSAPRDVFQDASYNVSYSERTTAAIKSSTSEAIADAISARNAQIKPIEVRYAQPVSSGIGSIDGSSMSLLQRSRLRAAESAAAPEAKKTEVRFTESATEAQEARMNARSASLSTVSAPASRSASGASRAASGATEVQARTGAANPASEGSPAPKTPTEPSKLPAQRCDLYVKQGQSRREEDADILDEDFGSDIIDSVDISEGGETL